MTPGRWPTGLVGLAAASVRALVKPIARGTRGPRTGSPDARPAPEAATDPAPGQAVGHPGTDALAKEDEAAGDPPQTVRVHAALRPLGLVEIDGVVYPATWAGPEPGPGRDVSVHVTQDATGEFTATLPQGEHAAPRSPTEEAA